MRNESESRLWRLDGGTIRIDDLSLFSDTFKYAGRRMTFAVGVFLIRHGRDHFLWDAGLPKSTLHAPFGDAPKSPRLERTLVDQLREIGVDPARIGIMGLSHNHIDHVGQAEDFAGATLMMGDADLRSLRNDPSPPDTDPAALRPWLTGGAPTIPVTGDRDVFGDGSVVMLAMPGHTPGSYALLVRLPQTGPVLLSGDAAVFREQFDDDEVPPANADRARSLASAARLRGIARSLNATLVIQHDARDVSKLPLFPNAAT